MQSDVYWSREFKRGDNNAMIHLYAALDYQLVYNTSFY